MAQYASNQHIWNPHHNYIIFQIFCLLTIVSYFFLNPKSRLFEVILSPSQNKPTMWLGSHPNTSYGKSIGVAGKFFNKMKLELQL